jgi:DNA-binding response OmpR family regulator
VIANELQVEDDSLLDVVQRQLVVDGRCVDLTKLEFEVMNYLQHHQGRIVDRRTLLQDVWGYDAPGGSNVIEALVRSLRRKLGNRASVIQTVRGIGYRLAEGV